MARFMIRPTRTVVSAEMGTTTSVRQVNLQFR